MGFFQKQAIILASGSSVRRQLLEQAGLQVKAIPAGLDERVLQQQAQEIGMDMGMLALHLAEAKAVHVARSCAEDAVIIGADQVLGVEDRLFAKPRDMKEAREHLRFLRGRRHCLYTAVVVWRGNRCLWQCLETPTLTMRQFSDAFLEAYLAHEGLTVCQSVGAYRLEGPGVHLFIAQEGHTESILGLPLLPLLQALRQYDILAV